MYCMELVLVLEHFSGVIGSSGILLRVDLLLFMAS